MRQIWRRLHWFWHRDRFEREMEEEIRHHLTLKALEQGSAEAANRAFGNVTWLKEESRMVWIGRFWDHLAQDLRYGLRTMAGNKLFSAMAVLSLALGIGANTAIYSFMDAIMLRAMPVRNPGELVIVNWHVKGEAPVVRNLHGTDYDEPGGASTSPNYPFPAYEFLRDNNQVLSSLFAHDGAGRLNLVVEGQAELGDAEYVSGGYFNGLGVPAAAGRLIAQDDDRVGATPVVAIAFGFWQRRFGGSADAVGKEILLNGKPFTIAGVTAPGFFGVNPQNRPEIFIPILQRTLIDPSPNIEADKWFHDDHLYWVQMMGRLRPGVSLAQAQSELNGKFHGWVASSAADDKERAVLPSLWLQEGGSGVDSVRRQYSKPLMILMAMVGLILLIACANIANLLLARAEARRREMAVRLSLGAGRLRVMRQLLTESILLSLFGGVTGIFLAALGIRGLTWLLSNGRDNFTLHAQLDWRVLAFTLLVALVTGALFGLAPAIQATRVDITPALKETRASAPRGGRRRFGIPFGLSHILVVAQIAISLLLVAAAGLFVRTLNNLHSVNLGFNRENILLFSLNPGLAGFTGAALHNYWDDLYRRFRMVPGVRGVTMTGLPLVADWTDSTGVTIPGAPPPTGRRPGTAVLQVGPSFFETMQIPILLGRPVDERDRDGEQLTAVVNEVFAKKFFPDASPVGRHFFAFETRKLKPVDIEIVGVSRNARYNSLKRDTPPVSYIYYAQTIPNWPVQQLFFELRTVEDPLALAKVIRGVVHQVSPQIPVADMTTQARRIDQTISQERTFAQLCTWFGMLALAMACVGLYGTMAYAVSRRTSEIGIRMALGAERRQIVWMVLRQVLALCVVGVVVGMVAVWETTSFLKSFLFGLQPNDPLALGGAAAILIGCAFAAGYAPAWRASRIDPMTALRHE